ncbi:MAG: aldehyde dehydrogenase family protein [Verrucomicrobia bacterium]|nr:aldehyde dehydrogenase family protein [Verrucomicrobiota bacterium]
MVTHNASAGLAVSLARVEMASIPAALSAARVAQTRWADTPLTERLDRVRELRHLIADHASTLAEASASARQRPALESLTAEVLPLAEACRFLERHAASILAKRSLGRRELPLWLAGVRREIHREPLGVVLIIGPGNYPLLLPGVQLIQSLVAGNAVLLKPGVGGSGAALALIELIVRAGFPAQLVSLLPESAAAARAAIEARPDKVLFTGSAATGETILQQLAPHLIPATMELSGSDAVVVRADADLDLVTKALVFGLTLNAGATCMAPKRVFVHRSIATELEGRLARAFPIELSLRLEPLLSASVRPVLEEALAAGVHFIAGGLHHDGSVLAPVVLGGATPGSRLLREDLFAPVLIVSTVASDDEAVTRAHESPFALGASVFSRDHAASRELAARLHAGVVSVNDLIVPTADAHLPFGGRKRSGFGVTRGAEGLLELTASKVITVNRGQFRPAFEPPNPQDGAMFQAYLGLTHGRSLLQRARALVALFRSLSRRTKTSKQSNL